MDLAGLRSLVREVNFATHGVPAVVTPPGADAVETRIIWAERTTLEIPVGGESLRREPRRVMAIRRDDIDQVPRGTIVAVTEHLRTDPMFWKVDSTDRIEPDHIRVVVVASEES